MLFTKLTFLLTVLLFGTYGLAAPKHDKVVVCYVASWATYRPSYGAFSVENLRPEHCTHLVYSFAGLDTATWSIKSTDPWTDIEKDGIGNYRKMTALRQQYPHLKVTLGIGGWNEGGVGYSALASSPDRRKIFVASTIQFLKLYGFDGLDFVWMYPGSGGTGLNDKENFVSLLKELHEAYKTPGLSLTVAISAMKETINLGYNIAEISKNVDYIHVMSFDYHGSWNQKVLPHAPLQAKDGLSVEDTITYLMQIGAPAEKLVLAVPMYGRTYVLITPPENPDVNPIGLMALPIGFRGPYTAQDGFMGYNEICEAQIGNPSDWTTGFDTDSSSAYTINKDHVIVYDDIKSIEAKMKYIKEKNLAGVKIWSIDTDDFRGRCGEAAYPLMMAVNAALEASV
ncbi:probable chitinase 2 [Odontomachus brunneus]|uniref:probable chitinase 2 n=1 Tax=Odontomachus brunneus TaxID=486640 RepID=UPI0013F201B1|nr:probable chitinase 2 [Odontomachus brunneus]